MNTLKAALESTGYPFAHYAWASAPSGTYGTYAEDSSNRLTCDNRTAESAMVVYVNLFTKDDSDEPRMTVESAIDGKFAWYLNTVQFEDDTGLIHYEWVIEA